MWDPDLIVKAAQKCGAKGIADIASGELKTAGEQARTASIQLTVLADRTGDKQADALAERAHELAAGLEDLWKRARGLS